MLTGETKEYIAGFRLGIATDTQDISGKILEEKEVCVSAEQVKEMLSHFVGEDVYKRQALNSYKYYFIKMGEQNEYCLIIRRIGKALMAFIQRYPVQTVYQDF